MAIIDPTAQFSPRVVNIPNGVREMFSGTHKAEDCFIKQSFSDTLQGYLVGYVNEIYSNYSVYK